VFSSKSMTASALRFLESLSETQRARASFSFADEAERTQWFYTSTDHGGLPLTDCSAGQQQMALRVVADGLSASGYATASAIMATETILEALEDWKTSDLWGHTRTRDPLRYAISVFGAPEGGERWGWRFGGHHLSLNYTVQGDQVVSATPSFFGADPASHPLLGGAKLRPLGAFEDLGRAFVHSLDDEQRQRAIISPVTPGDIVTGTWPHLEEGLADPGASDLIRNAGSFPDIEATTKAFLLARDRDQGVTAERKQALRWTREPKGIASADLRMGQREMLEALIDAYTQRIPPGGAPTDFGENVHFAWAGATEPGSPHYYRLQAQRLLIEYDNTQRDANHIHSVWRDPEADFGFDPLAQHYANFHTPTG
jgi:Protein of unknown function (DUF3500)